MKGSPDASGSKSNTPLCIAQMSNLELDDMEEWSTSVYRTVLWFKRMGFSGQTITHNNNKKSIFSVTYIKVGFKGLIPGELLLT